MGSGWKTTASAGLALVLAAVFLAGGRALAGFEGTVVVVVPRQAPKGVDLKALLRAIEVYLQDFSYENVEVDSVPEDSAGQLAQASEVASRKAARFAVWYRWSGLEWSPLMSTHVAELGSPEVRLVSFAVEYPKAPDASFYRLVGLKLRSALRAAAEPPPARPPKAEPPAAVAPEIPAAEPTEAGHLAIELGSAGRVPPGPFELVASFGGSAHYQLGSWSAGIGAMRALTEVRQTPSGFGETQATRLAATVQRRLVVRGKLSVWAALEGGVMFVHTSARLADEDELRSAQDVVPLFGASALASYPVARNLEVRGGPTFDIYPAMLKFLVRDDVVYSSGRLQPGLDLRIRAAF